MEKKKASLACILYHNPQWPFEWLLAAVSCLAKSAACKSIFCPGYFDGPTEARILNAAIGKKMRFMSVSARASWEDAFNSLLSSSALREEYLLIFSTAVTPLDDCIDRLGVALSENAELAGAAPVFLNPDCESVLSLGIVADSGGYLHFLYPGIPADAQLAWKDRPFQLADCSLCCLRRKTAREVGGLDPALEGMAGLSLTASMALLSGKPFFVTPEARAVMANGATSAANCWLWNSFAMRGKIPQDLLKPDYARIVLKDGLEYGIDEWLNEGPQNLPLQAGREKDPLIGLLSGLNPQSLLAWLASLPETELPGKIERLRQLPWLLPRVFAWYEARVKQQADFANEAGLERMLAQTEAWLVNARRFHYSKLRPGMRLLQKGGIYNSCLDFCPSIYDAWLELGAKTAPPRIEEGASWPRIAIVMPVWNPQPDFLRQAVQSVLAQSNPNWEMRIADDCSTRGGIREMLTAFARDDRRIKVVFRSENGHISRATNSALAEVDAPWVAFMDHDDRLAQNALAFVANEIAQKPRVKFIYSDEDHIDARNVRRSPIFRPGFDYALMFTGHLSCFRMDLLRQLNFLRPGLEGFQDSDLAIRASEVLRQEETSHISEILYHWRAHPQSTSMGLKAKPYVSKANIRSIEEELARKGMAGRAIRRLSHFYQKEFAAQAMPDCAVVVLQDSAINPDLFGRVENLKNRFGLPVPCQPFGNALSQISASCRQCEFPFIKGGWPDAINNAARQLSEKYLLFLYGGINPLPECEPDQLLLAAKYWQAGICAATFWKGGRLWNGGFFPDVTGLPFPLLRGMRQTQAAHASWCWLDLPHRAIGVCWQALAIDRESFIESGGLRPEFGKWTMADYCLRLEVMDKFAIVLPQVNFAIAQHEEYEVDNADAAFLRQWGNAVAQHPLRNARLAAGAANDWTLIFQDADQK